MKLDAASISRGTAAHEDNPVAVVGAACPLGRHLVDALVDADLPVRAVARAVSAFPARWYTASGFQPVCADIEDLAHIVGAIGTARRVVWLTHIRPEDPDNEVEANVRAIEELCRVPNLEKIVLMSSGGSVYGNPDHVPVSEEHSRRPMSTYGKAKLAMEDALVRCIGPGASGAILRPGNIYGKEFLRDDAKGVIGAFTRSLMSGTSFTVRGRGEAARDFIHADDVVAAILRGLDRPQGLAVWNVGTGVATRVRDVLESVSSILNRAPLETVHVAPEPTDVECISLAVSRIRDECGWTPLFDLPCGLRHTLRDLADGDVDAAVSPRTTRRLERVRR